MVILPIARLTFANFEELPGNLSENFFNVLNRDQRTILTIDRKEKRSRVNILSSWRISQKSSENVFDITNSDSANSRLNRKSTSRNWNFWRRKKSGFQRLFIRLGKVFIVGVSLLTLVRIPAVMSAPYTRHPKSRAMDELPSYMHPCGKGHEEEMSKQYSVSRESDPEILKHIIIRTKSALSYAESFRDRYVEKTFQVSFDQHHTQWAGQKYDWLPNDGNGIPKGLGQNVDKTHLKSKTFDDFLTSIYEHLQKFAVALEQVVWDQKKFKGEFKENFRMTEVHLRNVLCEIRIAMIERNVTPKENVPRSIMAEEFRKLESTSYRNLRDWFIFRDLMNSLEYVIQVFTFIEENLSGSFESLTS